MISIKAYARKIDELFTGKSPFEEMETKEAESYNAIKKHSLDVAKKLKINADKLLSMTDLRYENGRNGVIRKYFKECLADGKPHKMNDIKDYIFAKMKENGEYNGERSSSYIYTAVRTLVENEGEYKKVARGVYQIRSEQEVISGGSLYSMDDVGKLLNSGFTLSEKDIRNLISVELAKTGIKNEEIISQISDNLESSIDNISYLIAFAEDYMDRREEAEENQGIVTLQRPLETICDYFIPDTNQFVKEFTQCINEVASEKRCNYGMLEEYEQLDEKDIADNEPGNEQEITL